MRHHCRLCERSFAKKMDFEQHQQWHADPDSFTCGECGKKYTTKKSLDRHLLQSHKHKFLHKCPKKSVDNPEEPCDYGCRSKERLEDHLIHHHGIGVLPKCPHCSRNISIATGDQHIESCKFSSTSKNVTQEDIDETTGEVYCIKCAMCDRKFSTKKGLRGHIETTHKSSAKLICELCGVLFHSDHALETHKATLHPDTEETQEET